MDAACNGTSFGASTPSEADLAEIVLSAFPHMQKIRFVNSGTEATMSAIRLARAYTKRKYIVKFEGCYHGHSDALLVKAGSGIATLGIPGSAGVPEEFIQFTLALPFNDGTDALERTHSRSSSHRDCVRHRRTRGGWQHGLRTGPRRISRCPAIDHPEGEKSVLIFDEVMTGFRLAFGGAQELYGVTPDLTTMGKIIGGGLPVGAYGGPSEIMNMVAPLGPMYQAGTLSGNPLAMAAGLATLRHLRENKQEIYPRLDKLSGELVEGVAAAAKEAGVSLCYNRIGSMFTWFFTPGPVTDWDSAAKSDTEAFGRFFRAMLDNGVYLPPSQFRSGVSRCDAQPKKIFRKQSAWPSRHSHQCTRRRVSCWCGAGSRTRQVRSTLLTEHCRLRTEN